MQMRAGIFQLRQAGRQKERKKIKCGSVLKASKWESIQCDE